MATGSTYSVRRLSWWDGREPAVCRLHKAATAPLRILYILDAAVLSTDQKLQQCSGLGSAGVGGAQRRVGGAAFRRSTWSSVCRGGSERPWPAPGGPCRCSALRHGCPPHWDGEEKEEKRKRERKGHSFIFIADKKSHQHLK